MLNTIKSFQIKWQNKAIQFFFYLNIANDIYFTLLLSEMRIHWDAVFILFSPNILHIWAPTLELFFFFFFLYFFAVCVCVFGKWVSVSKLMIAFSAYISFRMNSKFPLNKFGQRLTTLILDHGTCHALIFDYQKKLENKK